MPNLESVAMRKAVAEAAKIAFLENPPARFGFGRITMRDRIGAMRALLDLDILAIIRLTAIHFDEKTFYEKYDRASVEAMSERGGW